MHAKYRSILVIPIPYSTHISTSSKTVYSLLFSGGLKAIYEGTIHSVGLALAV